ncbi:28S ribosomal protein S15, mitochondrial-like [Nilaparvata lugens]|uniref:28S ribosomal protein S15, mitochondrial-like n=1 Tax=Nilaparvata lugens TaxID=108931 RepID=UPI00193D4C2E|nr:28S ribosomal protein S15, mitochondrial-like [Nilaparvata lugens]
MIDMRKKHLRLLRQADYKLFEWILDELDLEFKPTPRPIERVERKQSMRKLTDQYCEKVRDDKLAELRAQFEAKQIPFLEEKLAKLEWIKENESKYKLPESVTDDDIENTRKRLEELKMKREEKETKIESSN